MTTQRPDPRLGTDLGPYHIESVIGRGGMGVVYLATHTGLDRKVALKLLSPDYVDDEAFRARFLRESKLAAAIDHANIVPIYDAGELDGTFYLAMRYVEGVDLATRLRAGPFQPQQAVSLLAQVAGALDAAHAAGLVHRDVKPANLLMASGQSLDGADHVYLTDFGLTKQRGSQTDLTQMGGFLGTLDYIAPEQIEGRTVDGQADQYALAGVAVTALSGTPPFPRDADVAVINAHLHDMPPSLHERRPEIPVEVDTVIARGMAKAPTDRYPDCRLFVDDLRAALRVSGALARPVTQPAGPRDLRLPLIIGSLAVIGLIALAAFVAASSGSPSSSVPGLAPGSPSAAAPASPTDDVFPSQAEAALLRSLPQVLAPTCARGPYNELNGWTGASTPVASLTCTPGAATGASTLLVRQFPNATVAAGFGAGVIGRIALGAESLGSENNPANDIRAGDCAVSERANGRWERSGAEVGAIICYVEPSSGDATLWWTYDAAPIVVKATNQRGESTALYSYFTQIARFIAP